MASDKGNHAPGYMLPRRFFGKVFLSSTRNDLLKYRGTVIQSVREQDYNPVDAHDIPAGNDEVTEFLDRQIRDANIYLGILGFRYGTRIVKNDRTAMSFTEFEYTRAMLRHHDPGQTPVYIFLPAPESKFQADVLAEAKKFDQETYTNDPGLIAEDEARQLAFIDRVKTAIEVFDTAASGTSLQSLRMRVYHRMCYAVESQEHLGDRVGQLLYGIRRPFFDDYVNLAAPEPLGAVSPGLLEKSRAGPETPAYEPQLSEFQSRLTEWTSYQSGEEPPPAMCLVLHGTDAERTADLARELCHLNPWGVENPDCCYQFSKTDALTPLALAVPNHGILLLYQQVYGLLDVTPHRDDFTPEALAELLFDAEPPLMMCLCHLNLMPGMLDTFVTGFWQPLYDQLLRVRRQRAHGSSPVLLMVTTFSFKVIQAHVPLTRGAVKTAADYRNPIFLHGVDRARPHTT